MRVCAVAASVPLVPLRQHCTFALPLVAVAFLPCAPSSSSSRQHTVAPILMLASFASPVCASTSVSKQSSRARAESELLLQKALGVDEQSLHESAPRCERVLCNDAAHSTRWPLPGGQR
jgi:hypothetical protein